MKIIMIYDQIQSGQGTKDDRMVPLGATKELIGQAVMMEPHVKKIGGRIVASLYCGDGYFEADPDEVSRKLCAMVEKLKPDAVMCGPAFNFLGYGKMAARVAAEIREKTTVPVLAAMSRENEDTIAQYKEKIHIVETPKKGGTGLNEALEGMCLLAEAMVQKKDVTEIARKYCF